MKDPPSKFCSKATLDKHPKRKTTADWPSVLWMRWLLPCRKNSTQYTGEEICAKTMRTQNCIGLATFNWRSIPPDPKFNSTMTNWIWGILDSVQWYGIFSLFNYYFYAFWHRRCSSSQNSLMGIFTQSIHSPTPTFSSWRISPSQ